MSERSLQSSPMRRAEGRWLLALAVAGSALAVGSVHTVTLCVVTAALACAAGLAWWHADPMKVRRVASVLLVAGLALTTYTLLQTVPMPLGWLAAVAPHNADVWTRALSPLHEAGPRWAPISLDPTATRVEVLKGVAYLLAFVTAIRIARKREGVAFLAAAVIITGLALAAAALLHPAFGMHKLYGIYAPGPDIADRHIAPLMNPNNLAGYLTLALCLALAATLTPEPYLPRAIMAAVVLVLGAAQVWIASRGGVLTMVVGALLVLTIVQLARSRGRRAVAKLSIVSSLVAAVGAVLIVLGGSQDASSELLETNASKLRMLWHILRMLPAVPFFGCGRGAFGSAFPAFRVDVGYLTYAQPENVIVQWVLEWGTPVGIAGLAAMVVALRPDVVLARSTTGAGAWAGLVAVTVQNLGDFGTEIPGFVLAGVLCAAIVVSGTPGRESTWRIERWLQRPRRVVVVGAAGAVAAIALAASGLGREVQEDQEGLRNAVLARHISADQADSQVRAAMLRHPAEPYLPFIVGLRASFEHDDNPMPWLGATLERAHVYAPAHLVLAHLLAARSPAQARLEYRLAMEQAPDTFESAVMAEAPRVVLEYDDALELVPEGGKLGASVLDRLSIAVSDRLPATSVRLDLELARRAPSVPGPATRAAHDAVEDLEDGDSAPWCIGTARDGCVQRALDEAALARKLRPEACEPLALRARARVAAGDVAAALRELASGADRVRDRVWCLQQLEAIATAAGDERTTQEALDKVTAAGCGTDVECAQNLEWVAGREQARGNQRKALALYKRAHDRSPDDDALLQGIAKLASQAGLHAEAADDYERLSRRHPDESQWKQAAASERQKAIDDAMQP